MTDVHDIKTRSFNMSMIKGKNTKPEIMVRKFLFKNGFRYRLNYPKLPGKPDIVLPKYKTAIFVNGCFWHGHKGCKYFVIPKIRTDWWLEKINGTIESDKKKMSELLKMVWNVKVVWECELKPEKRAKTLVNLLVFLKKKHFMNFIDLFSGAGGLSEGFIRAGFKPIAHVEIDKAACNTMITRAAYHYLKKTNNFIPYLDYIQNKITRTELYSLIPDIERESVINLPIGEENNKTIFDKIDSLKGSKSIDFIIGGPPCQAYSLVGRARDENKMEGDSRNYLFKEYAKFLEYYNPKYFVFENVLGLLSAKTKDGKSYFQMMRDLFKGKGYHTEYKVLEAKDFGVLQNRKRIILIGKRNGQEGFYPEFEKVKSNVTVSEIFKDLPKLQAGAGEYYKTKYRPYEGEYLFDSHIRNGLDFTTQHIARPHTEQDKGIYKLAVEKWDDGQQRLNYNDIPPEWQTHKNTKSFVDRFKVVAGDLPYSQTVVAHICKDGHYYIHPDKKQNRSLTPREAARLQTFPDDFFFEGISEKQSRTAAFKQIGNAVPPLMAESIANKLKDLILNERN